MVTKNPIRYISHAYSSMPLPVKVSAIYMICSIIERGIYFFAVPIYTRLMPSEQYGIYSVFQSWESLLIIFATLNLWNYLFSKGMIKYEHCRDRFASSLIGLSWACTLLLFMLYVMFSGKFEVLSGLSSSLVGLMFVLFCFQPAYMYWCARQRFEYDVKGFAIATVLIAFFIPVSSIVTVLLFKRAGNKNLGMALILCKVLVPCIIYMFAAVQILKRSKVLFDKEIWGYALRFNLPLIPHFLSLIILNKADQIMIGRMCGNSDAGVYSVAYSAAYAMCMFNNAINDTIIPWLYKKMKEEKYGGIAAVGTAAILAVAVANILISLLAPEVIAVIAPAEYKNAAYIIPPVAISNVFTFMFSLFANIEYYFAETRFVAIASTISAVANVILNFVFIRRFGFIAAGYTTVFCYALYALCHCLFMIYILKKHHVVQRIYNIRQIWFIGLGAMGVALGTIVLFPFRFLRLGIVGVAFLMLLVKRRIFIEMLCNIRRDH